MQYSVSLLSCTVSQNFNYPYRGAPTEFLATIAYLLAGATSSQPVHVRIFISGTSGPTFNILNENDTVSGQCFLPRTI